ncbi:hypothetical protein CROQUDRAFT_661115 [Cronartium quercuum f. sp. fusiforme G11]|uniref:DNA polymerase epsilon subunit D n=1 Tax=Cronartium quercuum f. sp. fusiforme G11 TaxID=708437 RepID=A0A9P6T9D9_9BASI|nr:hypothetical protein CROQUDRAFT_661115 [Cronartium quercuum f. sp. fusiforme G11]
MPKVKKIVQTPDVQQSLGGHQQASSFLGIEAVELPRAVVMKLAKSTGPGNMKLAKEVPVALTKASTVFINYLVSIAHGIAAERSEKSLSARHILEACRELDWQDGDEMLLTLKLELEAFRKLNAAKKVQKANRSEPVPEVDISSNPTTGAIKTVNAGEGSRQEPAEENGEDIETEEEMEADDGLEDEMQVDDDPSRIVAHESGSPDPGDMMEADDDENEA